MGRQKGKGSGNGMRAEKFQLLSGWVSLIVLYHVLLLLGPLCCGGRGHGLDSTIVSTAYIVILSMFVFMLFSLMDSII